MGNEMKASSFISFPPQHFPFPRRREQHFPFPHRRRDPFPFLVFSTPPATGFFHLPHRRPPRSSSARFRTFPPERPRDPFRFLPSSTPPATAKEERQPPHLLPARFRPPPAALSLSPKPFLPSQQIRPSLPPLFHPPPATAKEERQPPQKVPPPPTRTFPPPHFPSGTDAHRSVEASKLLQNHLGSLNILDGLLEHKSFIALSSHSFPHAKTTGYFLVLVPLIAFCIRCIIASFHTRAAGELRSQVASESEGRHPGRRSMRWKSALSDIRETDHLDAESSPHSYSHSDDQSQVSSEEVSHAYSKLEQVYQNFLSECGMSEWGHWRGGSPE